MDKYYKEFGAGAIIFNLDILVDTILLIQNISKF